jgi:transposase
MLRVPGIDPILALPIMLETGDINRFSCVGSYASYCRCVDSRRMSNYKKKGQGNAKNGNKYLASAYVEVANFAIRLSPPAKRFYQRKLAQRNRVAATKTTAHCSPCLLLHHQESSTV